MTRFVTWGIAILALGAACGAKAQSYPSCEAADKARASYVNQAAKGRASFGDVLLSNNLAEAEAARGMRDETTKRHVADLAQLCVGDVAASGQYADAARQAAKYGLWDEAERLARIGAISAPK